RLIKNPPSFLGPIDCCAINRMAMQPRSEVGIWERASNGALHSAAVKVLTLTFVTSLSHFPRVRPLPVNARFTLTFIPKNIGSICMEQRTHGSAGPVYEP